MEFTSPRATFEETLAFANEVRRAGGGTPLDALMPAVPTDSRQCLIAKNLNFNSKVEPSECGSENPWIMAFDDEDTRNAVAEGVGLEKYDYTTSLKKIPRYAVILPQEISQVARDFDQAEDLLSHLNYNKLYSDFPDEDLFDVTDAEIQLVQDMLPYIQASEQECYEKGLIVDGMLVL